MNQHATEFDQAEPLSKPVVWAGIQAIALDPGRMARNRVVALGRSHPSYLAFDILRSKVLRNAREENWRSLGVTAPTSGCGKATLALNLALSIAKQQDLRVVLMDLDLRHPRLADILGHKGSATAEEFLTSGMPIEDYFVRIGDNLAVGASAEAVAHPAELLINGRTAWKLKRMQFSMAADIVIYNLPPMLGSADCSGLLSQLDRAILVVGAEFSTIAQIDVCERELADEAKLLGVVLNKCRYMGDQNHY